MDPAVIAVMIPLVGVMIPIVAIYTSHQRKVLEIKLRIQQEARGTGNTDVARLRDELAELRDTATRYDLSFDTALQRMESRLASVEERTHRLESETVRNQVGS